MAKRVKPGQYEVGRVKSARQPRRRGEYGVIKGAVANEDSHLEWSVVCEGALKESKWFVYRIGPMQDSGGRGPNEPHTELQTMKETKAVAVAWIKNNVDLDETVDSPPSSSPSP